MYTSVSVDIFTTRYIFGKRKVNFLVVFVRFGSFSVFIDNNVGFPHSLHLENGLEENFNESN